MNTKKRIALILAALLATASLNACSKNPTSDAENSENSDQNTVTPAAEGTIDLAKACELIEEKVGISDDDTTVLMTLDGYDITYSEYRYYYLNYVKNFASYYGTDWQSNDEYAALFDEYFDQAIKMNGLVANLAAEQGIALTEEEFNTNVSEVYDSLLEQFGENAVSILDETYNITPYYLMKNETIYNLYMKMYDKWYAAGGERYEDIRQQTLDYYNENNYVRAKHILIKFPENEDGSEPTEEQKLEAYAKAEEVLAKARNGEDFDSLIEEYNEDPGMASNTAGYYFTTGEMVEEFESAAFALSENGISDIVETSYGYHIIERLPIDDEDIATSEQFYTFAYQDFDSYFQGLIQSAELVKVDNFESLVQPINDEADAYIEDLILQENAANTETSAEPETDAVG